MLNEYTRVETSGAGKKAAVEICRTVSKVAEMIFIYIAQRGTSLLDIVQNPR